MSALIAGNADYLVNSISLRLRQASRGHAGHSEAIQVLGAVMRHGEESVCGMVRVTVSQLLLSLDTRQLGPALVWEGLCTLAHSCKCWLSNQEGGVGKGEESEGVAKGREEEEEEEDGVKGGVGIQAIADFFLKYHRQKEREEEEDGEGGGAQATTAGEEQEDYSQERTLSAAEQVSVDIIQRCRHHMAHDTPTVRMVVMETLEHCMEALRHDKVVQGQ